jgi:hypothetical protein
MAINSIRMLTWFLVGAVLASPLGKLNKTEGLSSKLKGIDFSRLEPIDRYKKDDLRFPLKPSLFAAPVIGPRPSVTRPNIRKKPDTEENEPKYNQTRQFDNKTEHDGHMVFSLDNMEGSEDEKALIEALLKILNEPLEEIAKENPTGHTQSVENPWVMPYLWRDSNKLYKGEDKDQDKEYEEDDSDSDSDSGSDDEEDGRKDEKEVSRIVQKRDDKKEEKPYLWPEHNRPKASKDGKFTYLYSSEGKQYAVANPQPPM